MVARDRAGNVAVTPLAVQFQNASVAARDATLGAPACAGAVAACDSTWLLEGSGADEPGAPSTLGGACLDPDTEGLSRVSSIRVSTLDGAPLTAGQQVLVAVRVDPGPVAATRLDLFHAADADAPAPAWRFVASVVPAPAGEQVLHATVTLASGGRQALRAKLHELTAVEPSGEPPPCNPRTWYRRDDHDDLVFEVAP